jgi:hypothetical protein
VRERNLPRQAIGALLVAVGLTFPAALVTVTIALSFGTGVLHPLRAAAIQRLASDGIRARAASMGERLRYGAVDNPSVVGRRSCLA